MDKVLTQLANGSDEYIARKAEHEGLPTVAYFADKCCYSTKYFGELVIMLTTDQVYYFIFYLIRHS